MVTPTSRLAFHASDFEPKEQEILRILRKRGAMNRRRIAKLTGIELGSVCGRVNHLLELKAVELSGVVVCPITGKLTERVRVAVKFK